MKKLLTSCFGLGLLPVAPGTFGSLPPVVIYIIVACLCPAGMVQWVMAAMVILAGMACVAFSNVWITRTGRKDPGQVVIDEFAGQSLALFILSFSGRASICTTAAVSFLLFRIFDILKPPPCRRLEKLPGGWGILADDLAAGIYAAAVFLIASRLGLTGYVDSFLASTAGLDVPEAVMLGGIQGLTEFLPVSSSGHLVMFESFFKSLSPDSPQMLCFDLALHVGTVGSILVVYRRSILKFFGNFRRVRLYDSSPIDIYRKNPGARLVVLAIAATAATGVVYELFRKPFESARTLEVVAAMWFVTAGALFAADMRKEARRGLRDFGILSAVIIGLAQGVAILPGISRSGATIAAAILLGIHRRWAVEFSFLISIPAILGATILKFVQDWQHIKEGGIPAIVLAAGTVTAFLVGIMALRLLILSSRRRKLKVFAVYCCILAIFVSVLVLVK